METVEGAILSYAIDSIGQEENKGNQGFKDPEFDEWIRVHTSFQNGHAWCCYFVWACWRQAYLDFNKDITILDDEFSGGTVRTWRHFKKLGWTSMTPVPGAIAIWQTYDDGDPLTTGHAAIVKDSLGESFHTIEGNTNAAGGREGIEVAEKTRKMNFSKPNGLRLLGFIHPKY